MYKYIPFGYQMKDMHTDREREGLVQNIVSVDAIRKNVTSYFVHTTTPIQAYLASFYDEFYGLFL